MTPHFLFKSIFLAIFLMALLVVPLFAESAALALAGTKSPLLISVENAVKAKKKNFRTIFVDVRREESFVKIHIPGSINVPLHFIKTKSYLKSMYVVLVGQGYTNSLLVSQAELLNAKGIETVVLGNGLAAWSQGGQRLISSGYVDRTLLYNVDPAVISTAEFSRYINITPEKTSMDMLLFSGVEHMPVASKADLAALAAMIDLPDQSPLDSILIFNRNGEYGLIEDLPAKCSTTLFFMEEGSEGYVAALHQQQAILQPKAQRMKTIGGCETCPSVQNNTDKK